MDFVGTWHIFEMEMWKEDYFNMEIQAFIKIDQNYNGNFQFGLVSGDLHGRVVGKNERLEFSFEGVDECDPCSGSGWIELKEKSSVIRGEFRFDNGDSSGFLAKKA
jgi:hypothetical protein